MLDRRTFLKTSSLIALAPSVPGFLARTARAAAAGRDDHALVVVQLDGGNDGINTIVPFSDGGYGRARQQLRLPTDRLLKIGDGIGLHPALRDAARLFEDRRLAIIQGVGYPNPSRSHAQSMAIWQTARFDPEEHSGHGWLGRALDAGTKSAVFLGSETLPVAVRGRRSTATAMSRLDDLMLADPGLKTDPGQKSANDLADFITRGTLDAYAAADRVRDLTKAGATGGSYPATGLAQRLHSIAQLLKSGFGARVYYTVQSGYDTHSAQLPTHADLLGELGGAIKAFVDDLAAAGLAERVAVLTFSEFGRRVAENASQGTDHGTAGPVFLAGTKVRAGLVGNAPKLLDLEGGDLKMGIDFRRVYASVLEDWLGLASESVLGGKFQPLPLFQA